MRASAFLLGAVTLLGLHTTTCLAQEENGLTLTTSPVEILDDDRQLFEFYSKEIAKMDIETIQKHPEIVFRKSLTAFHLLRDETTPQGIHYQLSALKRDLEFVMYYVESSSRLFKAAKLQMEHIDFLLSGYPRNAEELLLLQHRFFEGRLKEWATNKSLSGRELRENVFLNVQTSQKAARSFFDFAAIFTFEAEPILGTTQPIEAHLVGLVPQGNGKSLLVCQLRYQTIQGGVVKTTTWELGF